jgi:uncharacterized protein YuzE
MMRFEYDKEAGALYIYVREIPDGAVARVRELQEGVWLHADKEGRTLGIDFWDLTNFEEWLRTNGGIVEIPEHLEAPSPA